MKWMRYTALGIGVAFVAGALWVLHVAKLA
jgi:hypothetical protein